MLTSQSKRMVMVSFLSSLFPPIQHFFSQLFFPIKLLSLRPAGCLPSVYKSNKCSYCHHLFACRMEKAVTVSSPLIFIPTLWHFSQTQFNYYSVSCAGCPPSVNRGNKGLLPPSPPMRCVEKVVTLSFPFVFFHYFKWFLAVFFSMKLLFGGGVAVFHFHSPPHLIFTMSHVSIKICLPKLPFCVVN